MKKDETEKNAWEIVSSRYLVKDRWITLRADDCVAPDGYQVSPYYVLEYQPWINVMALTVKEEVVMIHQYRHGIQKTILEFPGGSMDEKDTSPADTAHRELMEETGYTAQTFVELASLYASPNNHTNNIHSFLALDARLVAEPCHEKTEQIEIFLMPLQELIEKAYQGELSHPHYISTLFFALRELGKN